MNGHHERIHRSDPKKNFTKLPNALLRSDDLSPEALGFLVRILSNRKDWKVTMNLLEGSKRGGREKVRRCIIELEEAGYAKRHRIKGHGGRFIGTDWEWFDTPLPKDDRTTGRLKKRGDEKEEEFNRLTGNTKSDRLTGSPTSEEPTDGLADIGKPVGNKEDYHSNKTIGNKRVGLEGKELKGGALAHANGSPVVEQYHNGWAEKDIDF
jgi:hypothetical protein